MRNARGFSLVEVVLALGVAAFCLISIFGLMPIGVSSNQMSIEQSAAANLATAVLADLQTIPKGSATAPDQTYYSPRYAVPAPPVPTQGTTMQAVTHSFFLREDGLPTNAGNQIDNGADLNAGARYRVTVYYAVPPKAPTASATYLAVPTRVLVTWPAAVDSTKAPPKNFSGSFEVATSLNRN